MPRFLAALATAFLLAGAPGAASAADCHGDCANCPRHKDAAAEKGKAPHDPSACACKGGKECKCGSGCKCAHCGRSHGDEAPQKAPAKT